MKYILEFTLKDKTKLVCVTNNVNRDVIVPYCISTTKKVFPNNKACRKCRLEKNLPYTVETWKVKTEDKREIRGSKSFDVLIIEGRNTLKWDLKGAGVKSLYNQVCKSLGHVPPMIIFYDKAQKPQKKSSEKKAEEAVKDEKRLAVIAKSAFSQLTEIPGIGPYLEDAQYLCYMVYDFARGKYNEVPLGTIIAITGILLYVLSPVDLIPDVLPVVGLTDDVSVIAFALKYVGKDLQKYKVWRAEQRGNKSA